MVILYDTHTSDLNKWFVITDTQNDMHSVDTMAKPFVDPDDDYMYSRTCEVKTHCQFTHCGQRKHLGNVICAYRSNTHPSHKSHHAPIPYSMLHLVTETYTYVPIDVRKWF